jgi:hypothetical protein
MNRRITITGKIQMIEALRVIEELPFDPVHEIIIQPKEEKRRDCQNRLMWLWITDFSSETGNTKEEIHLSFKERFAVPIFTRDDEGYAAMVSAVKSVRKQGMAQEADALKKTIVSLTSTTDFTVKQMAEYLHDIELEAANRCVQLRRDIDYYNTAMGARQ